MDNEDDLDVGSLARSHGPRAIELLANLMETAVEDKDQIRAAEAILDRGHGKPSQAIIAVPASRRQAQMLATLSDAQLVAVIEKKQLPRIGAPQAMITVNAVRQPTIAAATKRAAQNSHGPGADIYSVDDEVDELLL